MGEVIYFPFEETFKSKYAALPKEPAKVIVLPVLRIERPAREPTALLAPPTKR